MERAGARFRLLLRTVIYSVTFGTFGSVVFALVSGWQSWGSYWPSTKQYIVQSAFVGAFFSLVAGMLLGFAMLVSTVVFFQKIKDRRFFQQRMGLTPVYFALLALVLSSADGSAATYFRNLVYGPPWIKWHLLAFVFALASAAHLCRFVAGKYAREASPTKRKPHPETRGLSRWLP